MINSKDDHYLGQLNVPELLEPVGSRHYRLLSYLSDLFNGTTFVNMKTHNGYSTYALAKNPKNTVYTFGSIIACANGNACTCIQSKPNIKQLTDLGGFDPSKFQPSDLEVILNASIILIDHGIDRDGNGLTGSTCPTGHEAKQFYDFLKTNHYKGILICNQFWSQKEIRDNFWTQIPDRYRYDLTLSGHSNGTGLIVFDCSVIPFEPQLLIGTSRAKHDWTLVTAYFNLTHCNDHNTAVRPPEFYMNSANGTLSLPYNLIIYTDRESLPLIQKLRPEYLADRTRYVIREFDQLKFEGHGDQGQWGQLTFAEYRHKINENRKSHPYQFDPRNTASYYLFCMSRYLLVKHAITENPFHSTHFAWINICIERYGHENLFYLDEILSLHRDKFSTCYIDYIPPQLIENTPEYFKFGRCSMCSAFFTGSLEYMSLVCHAIETQFLTYLGQGYGHADEQLYSPVYFKHPEWFEHYYGDYTECSTNYCHIHRRPDRPIINFASNSYRYGNYQKCLECCQFILDSFAGGYCQLTIDQIRFLSYYKEICYFQTQTQTQSQLRPPTCKCSQQSTIITLLYGVGTPRQVSTFIGKIQQWLKITFPVIIYTNDTYHQYLIDFFKDHSNVLVLNRDLSTFPPASLMDAIKPLYETYPVPSRNRIKGTLMYHQLMYSRPYMWADAVRQNPFKTRTFICMDMGLVRFTDDISIVETWNVHDKLKLLVINPYLKSDGAPD